MLKRSQKIVSGFTLIEMLFVLVIVGTIVFITTGYIQQKTLQTRVDRASIQMQQILNAGLAYYVTNGKWPGGMADLQPGYLPNITITNPWGNQYHTSDYTPPTPPNVPAQLYVWTSVTAGSQTTAAAKVIAGLLPLSYTSADGSGTNDTPPDPTNTCTDTDTTCYVVASVTIPGQNLNAAGAVNFAGIYHHGACVPVPTCPLDNSNQTMIPQIIVAPVSVSGINEQGSDKVYPISSFSAYAQGNTPNLTTRPPPCKGSTPFLSPDCLTNVVGPPAKAYWRACLQVKTEKGDVQATNTTNEFGKAVTIMAITRCAIRNEPSGSDYTTVFGN